MNLRNLLCAFLALTITSVTFGQSEFKKAEKLLNLKAFDLAIKNYEAALIKYPDHAEGYAKLGNAYLMTNQLLESLKAYEKAFEIDDTLNPEYKLQYATALKKVGLYDLAESVYFEYTTTDATVASHMLASTEFAKSLLQRPDEYEITSFAGNSDRSDFGTAVFRNNLIFCSFRTDLKRESDKKNESYIQQNGNQIYVASLSNEDETIRFLRPDYKEIFNIGPMSYSKDGRMVAFMRNTFTSGSNQIFSDESNMSIYFALTNDDGDFTDERPFSFNQLEHSYAFPNLGFNGNALYFSSNKPGGYGGFDIYVSYFRDGSWGSPENLGPAVNSSGNEITPFFDGEKLYFASDFHYGLGGYDNFLSEVVDGKWSEAQNLGKGINSPSDDYYLTPDLETGMIYFTSNRLGGKGKDDIYLARRISPSMDLVAVEEEVPMAVNLDDLAMEMTEVTADDDLNHAFDEAQVVPVSSEESVMIMEEAKSMDLADAKLTSITSAMEEMEEMDEFAEVYFVQLASLSQSEGNYNVYRKLSNLGQLYRFYKSSSVKIRLGYYGTRNEAKRVLEAAKNEGFKDAFITRDVLATSSYELINSSSTSSSTGTWIDDFNPESSYKVKLASYLDPLKFQVDNVLDLGRLEQWSKGKWTIFILGGFETIDEAMQARIKAINRGFVDAELVEDNQGILSRVKTQ